MFDEVVDLLMTQWYSLYEKNKEKIEEDDDFNQSKERKKMNKFIDAIVILYSNKYGRP
jgi:hypothetical protein